MMTLELGRNAPEMNQVALGRSLGQVETGVWLRGGSGNNQICPVSNEAMMVG